MLVILIIVGFFGLWTNYAANYYKNHITVSFKEYMRGAFSYTLQSIGGLIASLSGLSATGQLDAHNPVSYLMAFTAGYMLDNLINKAPQS